MARAKVFVVDDDPTFIKLLERELAEAKLTPFETYLSGEECLANLNRKPKLILLDFSLSGLNGLDVLKAIKAKSPRTNVVMLTAVADEAVEQKCREAGASDYIHKSPDGLARLRNEILPGYRSGFFSFFR